MFKIKSWFEKKKKKNKINKQLFESTAIAP